jgi:hypothetical protein
MSDLNAAQNRLVWFDSEGNRIALHAATDA